MIIFENTKEVCMVFVTQQHFAVPAKKNTLWHFVATNLTEKASVESNVFFSLSNMQVTYLCEEIISSFTYLQKHIFNSEKEEYDNIIERHGS